MIAVTEVDHWGSDLRICNAARISFNKKSQKLEERDKKLIKYLAEHEHMCHDDQTEVLTSRGWVLFSELAPNDVLAAADGAGSFRFERPQALHKYAFEGNLKVCRSSHVDFAVTSNHRMWVSHRSATGHKPYAFCRADELGDGRVQAFAKLVQEGEGSYAEGQLYGFYLGDGFEYTAAQHAVRLKKQRKITYISSVLGQLGVSFTRRVDSAQVTTISWEKTFPYSTGSGARNKAIDPKCWNYSVEFLEGVLDGLRNSDGAKHRNAWTFSTTSDQLALDFERLVVLTGGCVARNAPQQAHRFSVKSRSLEPKINDSRLNNFVTDMPYKGYVYCATVSTGLLVTRRNGRVLVSGNSPFEHVGATFIVECPVYIAAQIMRHRTFSYNMVSRRYTSEEIKFYVPETYRSQHESNRQASAGPHPESDLWKGRAAEVAQKAIEVYSAMLDAGICREQARGVLPQDLITKFYMTGNLRNYAHFISLRTHPGAQAEVSLIASAINDILLKHFPVAMESLVNGKEGQPT